MPQDRESATLSDYTSIIARRWRAVVATVLVSDGVGRPVQREGRRDVHEQRIARDPSGS
jgi:hypothetical protein